MAHPGARAAGALFFVADAQFVLCLAIAEALYPGYSVHWNYVSDLGVGPSAAVFNASVFLLGLLLAVGAYILWTAHGCRAPKRLLFLMGLFAMGVGVVTKAYPLPHAAVSSLAFLFAGLSAIASGRAVRRPFSLISVALGAMTVAALALFSLGMVTSGSLTGDIAYDSAYYLGLGPGGMERMIVYPALVWLAGFSWYLATKGENPAS